MIVEWYKTASSLFAEPHIVERVQRLRRLLLVHSCIYYELNSSLISDHHWQALADELVGLQMLYGHEFDFYDRAFEGWDGSTGYHLPIRDPDVLRRAQSLLANCAPRPQGEANLFAA